MCCSVPRIETKGQSGRFQGTRLNRVRASTLPVSVNRDLTDVLHRLKQHESMSAVGRIISKSWSPAPLLTFNTSAACCVSGLTSNSASISEVVNLKSIKMAVMEIGNAHRNFRSNFTMVSPSAREVGQSVTLVPGPDLPRTSFLPGLEPLFPREWKMFAYGRDGMFEGAEVGQGQ